jgi:hypothetical protein
LYSTQACEAYLRTWRLAISPARVELTSPDLETLDARGSSSLGAQEQAGKRFAVGQRADAVAEAQESALGVAHIGGHRAF